MEKNPLPKLQTAAASTWAFAIPRGGLDRVWLRELSTHLVEAQRRVVWGVASSFFKAPGRVSVPEGVIAYPYFDLPEQADEVVRTRNPALHNVDGPSPHADRTRHLWNSFELGSGDVFFVPFGRLVDLEALWNLYAFTNISASPTTIFRLAELVPPSADSAVSHVELRERLDWIAYRLNVLDLPNKKILIWPGSRLIAALLDRAGLPQIELEPLASGAVGRGALLAVTTIGDDEQVLAESLSRVFGNRPVDVTSFDNEIAVASTFIDFHLASEVPAGFYDRLVIAPELIGVAARAEIDCPEGRILLLVGEDEALQKFVRAPPATGAPPPQPDAGSLSKTLIRLVDRANETPCEPAPVVVQIAPAWAVAGSSHVFQCQLDMLREQGYAVVCIHLDTDDWQAFPEARTDRLARLPGNRALHRWMLSRPAEELEFERAGNIPGPYWQISLEGEERIPRSVAIADSLTSFLRERTIRFVVLNYGHNWALIERLGLSHLPVILEAHDVRPVQHALFANAAVVESAVNVEYAMFARAPRVIFINESERRAFLELYPAVPATAAFPIRDEPVPPLSASRFETPVTAFLSLDRLPFDLVAELSLPREARRRRFIVFVGSNHAANVMSLKWFFLNAYPHGLVDENLAILVVGSIHEAFQDSNLPNVFFCGPVSNLESVYAIADVTILPVVAGTGLPIKTLDALISGTPFVATTAAASAIPRLNEIAGAYDNGAEFAARVKQLAFDESARDEFLSAVASFKAQDGNWASYTAVWKGAVKSLGIQDQPGLQPPAGRTPFTRRESAASRRKGRFYFWTGHGLEETVGMVRYGDGFLLNAAYARIGLTVAGSSESREGTSGRRLEVVAKISCAETTRVQVAVQGSDKGWFQLVSDKPQFVAVNCKTMVSGTTHHVSLEFRLDSSPGPERSYVTIQQLSANWC